MSDTHSRLLPAGFEFLRDASPDDLNGAPLSAAGHFIIVRDLSDPGTGRGSSALLWTDQRGEPVLETGTDFFTVLRGAAPFPSWLPEGWNMNFYPTGLDPPSPDRRSRRPCLRT
jgi:hypothetical protein